MLLDEHTLISNLAYTVAKKDCAKYFCQNFVKCLPSLIILGIHKPIAERIGLLVELYGSSGQNNFVQFWGHGVEGCCQVCCTV